MAHRELVELTGTKWKGEGELWTDPLGNQAERYPCTAAVEDGALTYTWSQDGNPQEGRLTWGAQGATWVDSWHQKKQVECTDAPDFWGLLAVQFPWSMGEGPEWRWRIQLSKRPSGELVMQMTVITPWGEEGRAVRNVFTRV